MNSSFLQIEQKKGDSNNPLGLMTVYAKVNVDTNSGMQSSNPIYSIIKNGLLVAQGNYRDQSSLRDFLKQELGTSLDDEEGMREFVENLGGIEGALDPEKFQEKIQELEEMEDFIPTPAKMTAFESEEAILAVEGDVFYAGSFENSANANLAINALAIYYQAHFRESQIGSLRGEIDGLISQLEVEPTQTEVVIPKHRVIKSSQGLSAQEILSESLGYIVPLLYDTKSVPSDFTSSCSHFYSFFKSYPHEEDLNLIISLIESPCEQQKQMPTIDLLLQKISYLLVEDFDMVSKVVGQLHTHNENSASNE